MDGDLTGGMQKLRVSNTSVVALHEAILKLILEYYGMPTMTVYGGKVARQRFSGSLSASSNTRG